MDERAKLLVTRPVWADQSDPWTEALSLAAQAHRVRVVSAPLQRLHLIAPSVEQALVHTLCEAIECSPDAAIWLISTSPAASQALGRLPALGAALARQAARLRLAATGEASAQGFAQTLSQQGIASVDATEIVSAGVLGDADALAAHLAAFSAGHPLALLLEGEDNRPDLARALTDLGFVVLRLPVYVRTAQPLPPLTPGEQPWWILISSSRLVLPAVEGLVRQQLQPDQVTWMGHHPAIEDAVRDAVPQARWSMVDRLTPSTILERISLAPCPPYPPYRPYPR